MAKKREKLPAEAGFQIARIFSGMLQKQLGQNLLAVYVGGSVAAGMALQKSDVDLIVVARMPPWSKGNKPMVLASTEIAMGLHEKFGVEVSPHVLLESELKEIKQYGKPFPRNDSRFLATGGVKPVFAERAFLKEYSDLFAAPRPSLPKLLKRYKGKGSVIKRILNRLRLGKRKLKPIIR